MRLLFISFLLLVVVISSCTVPIESDDFIEPEEPVQVDPERISLPAPEVPLPETPGTEQDAEDVAEDMVEVETVEEVEFQYPFLGEESADVTIFFYGDFGNELDSRVNFAQVVALKRDFVVSKKAKLVFKPYPFNSEANELAAEAALCMWEQGSKQYWSYHDALMRLFVRLDNSSLHNYIDRVPNVDKDAFRACMAARTYTEMINATLEEGKSMGLNQTPILIIAGNQFSGNPPLSDVKKAINDEVALQVKNPVTGSLVDAITGVNRVSEAIMGLFS